MAAHSPVWTLSTEQVYETLSTSAQGLSEAETALHIKHYGFNELPEPARRSLLLRFTDQLTHFMALLLWVAGTLAFISGTPELGWAIWAVIWINAGFSFWQEFQAEQALAALNKMLPAQAKVYRDGTLCEIPVREMVPGDVMQLEEGDPTEAALLVAAIKNGLNVEELQRQLQRIQEIPFDSRRRMMSVVLERSADDSGLGFELDNQSFHLKPLMAPYLIFY